MLNLKVKTIPIDQAKQSEKDNAFQQNRRYAEKFAAEKKGDMKKYFIGLRCHDSYFCISWQPPRKWQAGNHAFPIDFNLNHDAFKESLAEMIQIYQDKTRKGLDKFDPVHNQRTMQ